MLKTDPTSLSVFQLHYSESHLLKLPKHTTAEGAALNKARIFKTSPGVVIITLFRLEETFNIIASNHYPDTAKPTAKPSLKMPHLHIFQILPQCTFPDFLALFLLFKQTPKAKRDNIIHHSVIHGAPFCLLKSKTNAHFKLRMDFAKRYISSQKCFVRNVLRFRRKA